MGRAAHQVIGALAAEGNRTPSINDVFRAVAANQAARDSRTVYRSSARQRLAAAAGVYFAFFAPPAEWEFVGAEIRAVEAVFDLVWRDEKRRIWIDEIKSGLSVTSTDRRALEEQLERIRCSGRRKYRGRFGGIRVLLLAAPARSFSVTPEGERRELAEWQ